MKPALLLFLFLTGALLPGCTPEPPAEVLVIKHGNFALAPDLALRVFADAKGTTRFSFTRSFTTAEGKPGTTTETSGAQLAPGEPFVLCWRSLSKRLWLASTEAFLLYDLSKPQQTNKTAYSLGQSRSLPDLPASFRVAIDRAFPR